MVTDECAHCPAPFLVAATVLKGVIAAGPHQLGNRFAQLMQIERFGLVLNVLIDLAGQVWVHTLDVGGAVPKEQYPESGFVHFNVQFVGIELGHDALGDLVGRVTDLGVKGKIVHEASFDGSFGALGGQALFVVTPFAFVEGLDRHAAWLAGLVLRPLFRLVGTSSFKAPPLLPPAECLWPPINPWSTSLSVCAAKLDADDVTRE